MIDDTDRRIIEVLRDDARLSARAVARRLGLAAGTVTERVARLERSGVIRGYRAIVDHAALGRPIAFVVGLQITQGHELDDVLDELIAFDEVDDVRVVTGQWDLLVTGRVADPTALNALLTLGLWRSPAFRHSETMLVIDERREEQAAGT